MPYQPLSGSFSIQELVADWQRAEHTQPQVWLDLGAYRQEQAYSSDVWYLTQSAYWLNSHRLLQPLGISLPHWDLPSFEVDLSINLPVQEILTTSTRLAYGVSLASFLFFMGPIIILESQQAWKNIQASLGNSRVYSSENIPTPTLIPEESTATPEPYASAPEDIFSLRVPDLDIESVVVPNVDSTDKDSYTSALKEGIAHAAGSGFPDSLEENKTTYLFAHSTDASWNIARYNAQFYALKDAEIGQTVEVRFWNEDYTYRILEKKVIAADDTSYMAPQTEAKKLILQTCYPPGTTWKRLLIIAVPEEEFENYDLSSTPSQE